MERSSSNVAGEYLELTPASAAIFNHLIRQHLHWSDTTVDHKGIVISCRIRLARNLESFPFPNCANRKELQQTIDYLQQKLDNINFHVKYFLLKNKNLSDIEKLFLMERHIVSPDWIKLKHPAAVMFSKDEIISIMLNEEDHLRIQVLQPGIELKKAWQRISQLDDEIAQQLNFAFSDQFGYLTACPTNTGTGMRVSATLNLVGLTLTKKIDKILKDKFSNEIAIRGFYGEGTDVMGNIFQVSNRITMGRSEESILERFLLHANKLIAMEQDARQKLLKNDPQVLEDKVYRAQAILKSARILNTVECIQLINYLRLGVEYDLISGYSKEKLNEIMLLSQPAHFQIYLRKKISSAKRNRLRPEYIRKKIE